MNLEDTKKAMLEYQDLFGQQLVDYSLIKTAKNKDELGRIIDAHLIFIESAANDAQDSLERFKQEIGLIKSHLKYKKSRL